jgi:hypothetical protein
VHLEPSAIARPDATAGPGSRQQVRHYSNTA